MKGFAYFNVIHTRETLKHFPLNANPRLMATASPVSWYQSQLRKAKVTRCNSTQMKLLFLSTYLRVQLRLLSHATHAQRRARLWLPTWSSAAQSEKAKPNARKSAWRTLSNSRLSLCDCARWMAAHCGPLQKQPENSRCRWRSRWCRFCGGWMGVVSASVSLPATTRTGHYPVITVWLRNKNKKKKERKNEWSKCDILKSPWIDGLSGITQKKRVGMLKEMKTM